MGCPLGHSWMPPHLQPKSTVMEVPREGFWSGKNLTDSLSPEASDEGWTDDASKLFEKERNSSASSGGQRAPDSHHQTCCPAVPRRGDCCRQRRPHGSLASPAPCRQTTGSITRFPGRFFPFRMGQGFVDDCPLPLLVQKTHLHTHSEVLEAALPPSPVPRRCEARPVCLFSVPA